MRECAEAILRIDDILKTLSDAQRKHVLLIVFNTHHDTSNTNGKHVENTGKTPVFSGFGGALGGDVLSLSPKKRDPVRERQALEVLNFLNQKASKNYRPVEENLRFIRARLNTCSVADLKGVIARKTREWLNTEHAKFLRPATLFNATKFEQYIGEQGA